MQETYKPTFEERLNWLCNKANDILVYNHTSCKESSTEPSKHQFHVSCEPSSFRFGYQHATSQDYAMIIKDIKEFVTTLDVSNTKHASALESIIRASELSVNGNTPAERKQAVLAYDSGVTLKTKEPVVNEYKEYVDTKTKEIAETQRKHAVKSKLGDILFASIPAAKKDPNYSKFLMDSYSANLNQTDPGLIPTVDIIRENYVHHKAMTSHTAQPETPQDIKVSHDYFAWSAAAIAGAGVLALLGNMLFKKKKLSRKQTLQADVYKGRD